VIVATVTKRARTFTKVHAALAANTRVEPQIYVNRKTRGRVIAALTFVSVALGNPCLGLSLEPMGVSHRDAPKGCDQNFRKRGDQNFRNPQVRAVRMVAFEPHATPLHSCKYRWLHALDLDLWKRGFTR
jgi:hypothetical protein